MAQVEEIERAIAAHGKWKADLRQAIQTGTIDTPVETIQMVNQCVFGKWLDSSSLTPTGKAVVFCLSFIVNLISASCSVQLPGDYCLLFE